MISSKRFHEQSWIAAKHSDLVFIKAVEGFHQSAPKWWWWWWYPVRIRLSPNRYCPIRSSLFCKADSVELQMPFYLKCNIDRILLCTNYNRGRSPSMFLFSLLSPIGRICTEQRVHHHHHHELFVMFVAVGGLAMTFQTTISGRRGNRRFGYEKKNAKRS